MGRSTGRRVEYRRRGERVELGERERRRLLQLGVCLALFLTVFFARGLDRLTGLREELSRVVCADVDFEAAFADLGWALASGKPVGKSLGGLWVDVFSPQERESVAAWGEGPLYQTAQKKLGTETAGSLLGTRGAMEKPEDPFSTSGQRPEPTPVPAPEPTPEPTTEPTVVHMDYTGPTLPDNTTMDRYALGLSETVSPVSGGLNSGFGWREHPISGGAKFHYGVDLAAETGTEVRSFAAGRVEYIGESDVYGRYLQMDHGNGVTSFYAHCSRLCVQQGQQVAAGEKVAESGATGEVTGPHLHFELKKDGVRLNPAYYITLPS